MELACIGIVCRRQSFGLVARPAPFVDPIIHYIIGRRVFEKIQQNEILRRSPFGLLQLLDELVGVLNGAVHILDQSGDFSLDTPRFAL